MTDNQQLHNAIIAVDAYRAHVDTVAATELGRPSAVLRGLNFFASGAATALATAGGNTVAISAPDFDAVADDSHCHHGNPRPNPGRFVPAHNGTFLSLHRANLAALDEELERLRNELPTPRQGEPQ